MDKEQLKNYIIKLELPRGLEDAIVEMIDSASEVNKPLLDTVADLLENQANFYEKNVEILEEEAAMYEDLASELSALDEEQYADKMEVIANAQEELLNNLNQITTSTNSADATTTSPAEQVQTFSQDLAQVPQAVPTPETPVQIESPAQPVENTPQNSGENPPTFIPPTNTENVV